MTLPVSAPALHVEERSLSQIDRAGGVARRWSVRDTRTQATRLVILTTRDPGRWSRAAQWLCSCGLASESRPCIHVNAVQATLPPEPPAAA